MDTVLTELKSDRDLVKKRLRTALSAKLELLAKTQHIPNFEDMIAIVAEETGRMIKDHPDVPASWWYYVLRPEEPVMSDENLRRLLQAVAKARKAEGAQLHSPT